jgi:diguanylate cyclase (GGDEF)-like protein
MPNDPSTAPIARLRGEFACAATEIAFLREQAGTILRDLHRALILCSLFYVMFSAADVLALGLPGAILPLLARFSAPVLAWAGLHYARRETAPVDAAYRVASVYTLLGMLTYMIVVWHRPTDVLLHGTSVGLMAVAVLIFIPNRLCSAIAIALGSSLVFVAVAWYEHLEATRRLVSMTMLILFANAFGAVAANRHARLWREQYRTQQVLTNLSVRDPLTGCFNRRHLNAALLDGEIARARRYRLSLALIMCDLDGFKAINDTHGHQAGDEMLRRFVALLQALTREAVDTVVRYGGEEFLIILPETRLDGAVELAERVREAFAALRVECGDAILATTASLGVVGVDFDAGHDVTPQRMIAVADELMYEAKRGGRNQVRARALDPCVARAA